MSHLPCPHCGAERRYGLPEDQPDATPEPATCACGKEGPPNYPYEAVADKIHEASCQGFEIDRELKCSCGQPVAIGKTEEDFDVVTHRMPHCPAFRGLSCLEYIEWLNNLASRVLH